MVRRLIDSAGNTAKESADVSETRSPGIGWRLGEAGEFLRGSAGPLAIEASGRPSPSEKKQYLLGCKAFAGKSLCVFAPLAQLDRASVYGTEGCWFESSAAQLAGRRSSGVYFLRPLRFALVCSAGATRLPARAIYPVLHRPPAP